MNKILLLLLFVTLPNITVALEKQHGKAGIVLTDNLENFPNGATLDNNPDLESLLERASQFIDEKNFSEAIIIYRHLLSQDVSVPCRIADSAIIAQDDEQPYQLYKSLGSVLEAQISQSRQLLDIYRKNVDPELQQALLLKQEINISALHKMMRSHFLSQYGDDLAFFLMNHSLDKQNFSLAKSLLSRLLMHPDVLDDTSNISNLDIAIRSYVINKRLNITSEAEKALDGLKANESQLSPTIRVNMLKEMTRTDHQSRSAYFSTLSPVLLNKFNNTHLITKQEKGKTVNWWLSRWQRPYRTTAALTHGDTPRNNQYVFPSRADLVSRWVNEKWIPVDMPIFSGRHVYYFATGVLANDKRQEQSQHLVCLNSTSGHVNWVYSLPKLERSSNLSYRSGYRQVPKSTPYHPEEIAHFSNQLNQQIVLQNEKIFFLASKYEPHRNQAGNTGPTITQRGPLGTENNNNTLYAIDSGGTPLWQAKPLLPDKRNLGETTNELPRRIAPQQETVQQSFVSGPATDDTGLYICVSQGNNLYLQKRDLLTGNVEWSGFLCMSNQHINSRLPVKIALSDNSIFLSTGLGLVFRVNKNDGTVNWVARYKRQLKTLPDRYRNNNNYQQFQGWESNHLILKPSQLIVMPTDASRILYLDRESGRIIHQAGAMGCNYNLGVSGDYLYTSGPGILLKQEWRRNTYSRVRMANLNDHVNHTHVTGRPILSDGFILIPKNKTIDIYDPISLKSKIRLKKIHTIHVDTPQAEPLGNLFVHQGMIFNAGMGHIYPIEDSQTLLQKLEMTADVTPATYLQKSKIYQHLNQEDQSLEALIESAKLIQTTDDDTLSLNDEDRREIVTLLSRKASLDLDTGRKLLNIAFDISKTPFEKQTVLKERVNLLVKKLDFNRAYHLSEAWIKSPPLYFSEQSGKEILEYQIGQALFDIFSKNHHTHHTFSKVIVENYKKRVQSNHLNTEEDAKSKKLDEDYRTIETKKRNIIQQIATLNSDKKSTTQKIIKINKAIAKRQTDPDSFDRITEFQTERQALQTKKLALDDTLNIRQQMLTNIDKELESLDEKRKQLDHKTNFALTLNDKFKLALSLSAIVNKTPHQDEFNQVAHQLVGSIDKLSVASSLASEFRLTDSRKQLEYQLSHARKFVAQKLTPTATIGYLHDAFLESTQEDNNARRYNDAAVRSLRFLENTGGLELTNQISHFRHAIKEKWQYPLQGDNVMILPLGYSTLQKHIDPGAQLQDRYTSHLNLYIATPSKHQIVNLDLASGKPIWVKDITTPGLIQRTKNHVLINHDHINQSAFKHINTNRFYIMIDHGTHLQALDRLTGNTVWQMKYNKLDENAYRMTPHFPGRFNLPKSDMNDTALIKAGHFPSLNVVQGDGRKSQPAIRYIRLFDGSVRWQRTYPSGLPQSVQIFKNYIIVGLQNNNQVQVLDINTGRLLHHHNNLHSPNNMPFIPTDLGLLYIDYRNFKIRKWHSNQTITVGSPLTTKGGFSVRSISMLTPEICLVTYQKYADNNKQSLRARFINLNTRELSPILDIPGQSKVSAAFDVDTQRIAIVSKDNQNYYYAKTFDAKGKSLSFVNLKKHTALPALARHMVRSERFPMASRILKGPNEGKYKVGVFSSKDPSYLSGYGLHKQYFPRIQQISIHGESMLIWTKQAIHAYQPSDPVKPERSEVEGFWTEKLTPFKAYEGKLKDLKRQLDEEEQIMKQLQSQAKDLYKKGDKHLRQEILMKIRDDQLPKVMNLRKQIEDASKK